MDIKSPPRGEGSPLPACTKRGASKPFYASNRGLADIQMYRNKPSPESRLRAPQFSIGLKSNSLHDGATAAFELERLFSEVPKESAAAPAVVIKRRRRVDVSSSQADGAERKSPEASASCASEERRPRVFTVAARDVPVPGNVEVAVPLVHAAASTSDFVGVADALALQASCPRRPVSEQKRPGAVRVTRPETTITTVDAECDGGADRAPSDLQRDFDTLSKTLEELQRLEQSRSPFEIDMTINARWAQVDRALANLSASVRPRKLRVG